MKKRILSMLLVLTMVFSCLPATALADEAAEGTDTMTSGDVVYIPGTVTAGAEVEAYVVDSDSADVGAATTLTMPADLSEVKDKVDRIDGTEGRTAGRFWECVEVDGVPTVKRVSGAWYGSGDTTVVRNRFAYHETITALTETQLSIAAADGHDTGTANTCPIGFADTCGYANDQKYECANTLTIPEGGTTVIDLRTAVLAGKADAVTTLAQVQALTAANNAVINVYSAEATDADVVVVVEPAADFVPNTAPQNGDVFFIPGAATAGKASEAYVVASNTWEVGTKLNVSIPEGLTSATGSANYATGRFWEMVDGTLTRIHSLTAADGEGIHRYGYHDIIDTIDGTTITIRSVGDHNGKDAKCAYGFSESCGVYTTVKGRNSREVGPTMTFIEGTSAIIDLRSDVLAGKADAVTTPAQIKALTAAKHAVINTYVAEAIQTPRNTAAADATDGIGYDTITGTVTAFVVQDFSAGYTASYKQTVGTVENGAVELSATTGAAGAVITVTATANPGYTLESILVDGKAIDGNTYTIRGLHTVTATFKEKEAITLTEGDVVFVPSTVLAGSNAEGYVIASSTLTVGEAVTFAVPETAADEATGGTKRTLGRFWTAGAEGALDGILSIYDGTNGIFGYHDAIHAIGEGTLTITDANKHTGANTSCAYTWNASCGAGRLLENRSARECGPELTVAENLKIIDLRGADTQVTTLEQIKALTDIENAVINTYAPDGVATVIVVQEPSASHVTNYAIGIGEMQNGTVTVKPAFGPVGTEITVTAAPKTGYVLETILVNGTAIEGNTFISTNSDVVTATFVEAPSIAAGDIVYIPDMVRLPDTLYTGYVVSSSTLPIGSTVQVAPINDSGITEEYATNHWTGRFWTMKEDGTGTADKDVWYTPANTLGIHDRFVSYNAETNTMVISNAAGHNNEGTCAYRGGSETCGYAERAATGNECAPDGNLALAAGLQVIDLRELAEGETAVTDAAGIAALAANGEVVMNIYCANANEASVIFILEVAPYYTVTVTQPENGGTIAVNKTKGAVGEVVTVTYEAAEGYELVEIKANDTTVKASSTDGAYRFNIKGDTTVTATFRVIPTTYTVTVAEGIANGTVLVNGEASATVEENSTVTVTVTPDPNYEIGEVKTIVGETEIVLQPVDGAYSFVATGNTTVTATFNSTYVPPVTYTITVPENANGTVTVSKAEAEAGEIITVTATPAGPIGNGSADDLGYALQEIYVDGVAIPGNEFTVKGAHTVTAKFVKIVPFAGAQVDMGNQLAMQYAVIPSKLNGLTAAELAGCYAEITGPLADGTISTVKLPYDQWDSSTGVFIFNHAGMAAKQMTIPVYTTIYNARGNAISATKDDSIRIYVMRKLATDMQAQNPDLDALRLMVDMLNYGAEAQKYFANRDGYTVPAEDLANAQLTAAQLAFGTQEPKACTKQIIKEGAAATYYKGTQLNLEDRIGMQMAFVGLTSDMYFVVKLTHHNEAGTVVTLTVPYSELEDQGVRILNINELVVADGRQDVTVELYNGEGEKLMTVVESMESYLGRTMNNNPDFYQAIMNFSDAAYEKLH